MIKKTVSKIMPVMGFLFLTAFIRSATVDVCYTDYIRLINTYLPDVFSLEPYSHIDVFTRTPINYFERIVSVCCFGYSTLFDMIMGALGLTFCAFTAASYAERKNISPLAGMLLLFLIFSLDKWEMLTNGSGWVHFWATGLFFLHFNIYDRFRSGEGKKGDRGALMILPSVIILLFAGPYSIIYFTAAAAAYIIDIRKEGRKGMLAALVLPFAVYVICHLLSEPYEYAGATDAALLPTLFQRPLFFVSMGLKSLAGVVIGGETAETLHIPDGVLWVTGALIGIAYVWAIVINIKEKLWKKTLFPLMLIISAMVSHGIILYSRWVFLNDMYAMSSRYALQYMAGSAGILLTFVQSGKTAGRSFLRAILVLIAAGQLITTGREIHMAKYRREAFVRMEETALNYRNETDDTLKSVLQYSDPQKTRKAMEILEDNDWNVFRKDRK